MYNDYYLQLIDSKMSTNNSLLNDIITRQNQIIQWQESGDIEIQNIKNKTNSINNGIGILIIIIATILLWNFAVRCWK